MLPLSVSDSSLGTGGEVPPALRKRTAARTRTCVAPMIRVGVRVRVRVGFGVRVRVRVRS